MSNFSLTDVVRIVFAALIPVAIVALWWMWPEIAAAWDELARGMDLARVLSPR